MSARIRLAAVAALVAVVALAFGAAASGQTLDSQLSHKRDELRSAKSSEVSLTNSIGQYSNQIQALSGEIASLRTREAAVQQKLVVNAARLRHAQSRLLVIRRHLRTAIAALKQHLVAVYESGQPDVMNLILSARGFDQMISRYDGLVVPPWLGAKATVALANAEPLLPRTSTVIGLMSADPVIPD